MRFCPPCAICCTICSETKPKTPINHAFGNPTPENKDPFSLNKLLAVGTVTLKRVREAEPSLCDHVHTEDGWHEFFGIWHSGYLGEDDAELAKQIQFLTRTEFIRTTYNITDDETLTLRIYIVPVDLEDVKGRLHHHNRGESVLNPGRRHLRNLLARISRDSNQWHGYSTKAASTSKGLIYAPPDGRTLAAIYSDLASPTIDPNFRNKVVDRLLNSNDDLQDLGLRSTLYTYQRRSIAAMVVQELDLRTKPDPIYVAISAVNGREFYFRPGTMEFSEEIDMVETTRGGILCEELGTGKTVMVLGLILSTLKQLPSPPETSAGIPVVLTPVALRLFPSSPYVAERLELAHDKIKLDENASRVPSLVEILLHCARTTPHDDFPSLCLPEGQRGHNKRWEIENTFEMTAANDLLQENTPFYAMAPPENYSSWDYNYRSKSGTRKRTRIMYLSAATLVVVPANLLGQWRSEITKHCDYPLRVLVLRQGTKTPSARVLANHYDIILMTYNRYTAESANKDEMKLYFLNPCTCENMPGSRVPKCSCPDPSGISPFLRVRWKRLVIDEGHVSSALTTNLTPFTKLLSVERKWIVTGTPTTNLLGLSFGKNITLESVSLNHEEEEPSEAEDASEDEITDSSAPVEKTPEIQVQGRVWNKYDREDLNKLDNMITHFLAVPQFVGRSRRMSTHLRDPLMHEDGPRPGSIQVLAQLMQMIMIRHRIEDVEKDISLPPVMHESVLLDLHPIVTKSYNALQATIAINAIDSQRTDQDYLFHPRNTEYLQITVKNMSQLMFWHVDETLYNVDQLMENAQATIDRAMKRNTSREDIQLVQEAFKHIQIAATDKLWRQIQTHEDVPYRVYNIPRTIFTAWTRTTGAGGANDFNVNDLIHADRLLKLRDLITSRPLTSEENLVEQAAEVVKTDKKLREAFEKAYNRSKNKRGKKSFHGNSKPGAVTSSETSEVHAGFMVENAAKKAIAADTLKAMQKELDQSLAKLEKDDEDESSTSTQVTARADIGTPTDSAPSVLLGSSVLANVVVGSSASSKLNYIINEVTKYSADEKILIFSESELTLAHVAEALELCRVKFLRFTTQIQPQVREQLVLTFETSETYRVFLMELKHGARGLNLISASRVIFCEPVWQADVESQAIKRAHRIGQTRPISVKTLAIRGTAEENMVERRSLLKGSQDKIPKLIEESGMRHFIANPKFLTCAPEKLPTIEFPLIHYPRPSASPVSKIQPPLYLGSANSSGDNCDSIGGPLAESSITSEIERSPPTKRAKAVHFG